ANKRIVILEDEMDQMISEQKTREKLTNIKPIENFAKYDLEEITSTKRNVIINMESPKETSTMAKKPMEPKSKSPEDLDKKPEIELSKKNEAKTPSFTKNENIKQAILENAKELNSIIPSEEPIKKNSSNQPTTSDQINKTNLSKGTVYKIQVKASPQALNSGNPIFTKYKEIEESFENNLYKYLLGSFESIENAKKKLLEVRASGIQDAFLVKYTDGLRVKL
ncbi:MAG: hypothetical protein ACOVP5_07615, partial [Chitinophagales bacterium]